MIASHPLRSSLMVMVVWPRYVTLNEGMLSRCSDCDNITWRDCDVPRLRSNGWVAAGKILFRQTYKLCSKVANLTTAHTKTGYAEESDMAIAESAYIYCARVKCIVEWREIHSWVTCYFVRQGIWCLSSWKNDASTEASPRSWEYYNTWDDGKYTERSPQQLSALLISVFH